MVNTNVDGRSCILLKSQLWFMGWTVTFGNSTTNLVIHSLCLVDRHKGCYAKGHVFCCTFGFCSRCWCDGCFWRCLTPCTCTTIIIAIVKIKYKPLLRCICKVSYQSCLVSCVERMASLAMRICSTIWEVKSMCGWPVKIRIKLYFYVCVQHTKQCLLPNNFLLWKIKTKVLFRCCFFEKLSTFISVAEQ